MKIQKTLTLPHDDLEWFQDAYVDVSLSAVVSLLLHNFRRIHQDVGLTPKKAARDSAKETKDQIDEGVFKEEKKED